jgi:la-related protein 1
MFGRLKLFTLIENALNSGPMHPMYYYMPAVPMEPMRAPLHYIQNQAAPYPVLSPEAAELRSNVLTQVEYYFR